MSGGDVIKLSSPGTREYWEIPVLYEDEHLLALDKPSRLLTSPDRYDPARPNLMKLLHAGIERGVPWARSRGLDYLMNAHRLDFETSGILLLARNKPALVQLANLFGSERPSKTYVALVRGNPPEGEFECAGKIAPDRYAPGRMRISEKMGKRSLTRFSARERYLGYALLDCRPVTGRTHQIRIHLQRLGLPIVADKIYGTPPLLLSWLKRNYRLKPGRTERPLIGRVALHAEKLELQHPVTGGLVSINASWPKDFSVAVKCLRRHGTAEGRAAEERSLESDG